jgi:glutathionyl-hydroquinone reductase
MKKLKLGTRVIVDGVETFISELHADIRRGVYKVRTDNPTYEFILDTNIGKFFAVLANCEVIELKKAPKYNNYNIGDRVKFNSRLYSDLIGTITKLEAGTVELLTTNNQTYRLKLEEGRLKKLRIKLGEKK